MIAIVALLLAVPIELGLSAGAGFADAREAVVAPMLRARLGLDLFDHLSLNGALLVAAGGEPVSNYCGVNCRGESGLRAVAALASVRVQSVGDLQAFIELGAGIGHLINLSADQTFENPPLRGRGGPAFLVEGGGRWFLSPGLALGLSMQWTQWTHVGHPAYASALDVPAESDLRVSVFAFLLSLDFEPFR